MTVAVRAATPDDAEDVASLYTQLGYPTSASDVPARLADVLAEQGAVVVATDDAERIVGVMSLARHRTIHSPGPVAYITGLIIADGSRGQGVGRSLVETAKRWAAREGCVKLSVTSAEHRAGAHAFYPACGLAYNGRRFSATIAPGA